ncbi:hypothetical protein [Rhodoblastus sp.]|uniref:hypothetical protein n=1 Tax=Rhodoblastus sp. TaxID=1962975 RepID=UPI003F96B291
MPEMDFWYEFAGAYSYLAAMRAEPQAARAAGVFGAPAFVAADGEIFRGDDRFEQALDWAREKG